MDYKLEQAIDLVELLHFVLKKWRIVVLAALVGAIVLGGSNAYTQLHDTKEQPEQEKTTKLEELKENLSDQDIVEVNSCVDLYKSYAGVYKEKITYGNKSIILNLDPEHVFLGSATFLISNYYDNQGIYVVENSDASNIVALYRDFLTDSETIARVREVTGRNVEDQYIKELITVELEGMSVLRISVLGATEAECRSVLDVLVKKLDEVSAEVRKSAPHDIVKTTEMIDEKYDTQVSDTIKNHSESLANMITAMRNIPTSLTASQRAYYTEIIKQKYPDERIKEEFKITKIIKMTIGGAIAGFVFVFMCFAVLYVLGQNVRMPRDLSDCFGVRVIGTIKPVAKPDDKKLFSTFDNWYERLFDRREGILPVDNAVEMISAEIALDIKKKGFKKIFITTSCNDENVKAVISNVASKLTDDIDVIVGDSVMSSTDSLKALSNADSTIIVEKILKSKIMDVNKELEICKNLGVDVLGAVVVI